VVALVFSELCKVKKFKRSVSSSLGRNIVPLLFETEEVAETALYTA